MAWWVHQPGDGLDETDRGEDLTELLQVHQKSNLSTEARVEKNGQRGKLDQKLGGGNSNIFGIFTPYLGKISNLTSIFFKWVEITN